MDSILSVYVDSQLIGYDMWPYVVMGLTLQEISQYLLCKDIFLQTSYFDTTSVQGILLADRLRTIIT